MSDKDSEQDAYRLLEDIVLVNGSVDYALYKAIRYHSKPEYDHIKEDLMEEVKEINQLTEGIIAREIGKP